MSALQDTNSTASSVARRLVVGPKMGVVAPSAGSSVGGGDATVSGKTAVGGDCRGLTTWKGGGVEGEDADADRSQTDVGSRGWDVPKDSWDTLIP
jgi:hypothetical protein